jgi:hypothetical protein
VVVANVVSPPFEVLETVRVTSRTWYVVPASSPVIVALT